MGNAAYGAGLALLMLGRQDEAGEWLARAARRWRESWEYAAPDAWGRPIGAVKAWLIARRAAEAEDAAEWALGLGPTRAGSPIGWYAAGLALLVLGRWDEAARAAAGLRGRDDFPPAVADALAAIAAGDVAAYAGAADAVLVSFESREEYLEDAAVADTVLALQSLAERRGLAAALRPSPLLPGGGDRRA
jgi:tetratricopeptide (TPR) repeat protein